MLIQDKKAPLALGASAMVLAAIAMLAAGVKEVRAQDQVPGDVKQAAKAEDAVPTGAPQVALRLANLARETVRQKDILPPHFKQAAALLMAAAQLDPAEPRYPRTLAEALLSPQIRDLRGAREALAEYRRLAPGDQHAMVTFIDLEMQQYETADRRMEYLMRVLDAKPSLVPAEVRSHAALRISQLARERSQSELEDAMLGQALRLNPLNLDALRVRLEQQTVSGTATERVGTLLKMLRSNPAQPGATYRLAREFSDAGMPAEALQFYPLTISLAQATGVPMGKEFALAYGTALYMQGHGGQTQLFSVVKTITEQLLNQDAGDVESLLLHWYAQRALGQPEAQNAAATQQKIMNAALNRLLEARQSIGVTGLGATTRPVDNPEAFSIPGDLADDAPKLQEPRMAEARLAYSQALADLIWYLVYVDKKPEVAAQHLPLLKALLSDKHPVVVRIEGFIFLAQNQPDQAKVKLQAVAEQDVLAQMGMILIESADPAQLDHAKASARQLLSANPSGLLSVVLADGLKPLNIKLVERQDADGLRAQLEAFPRDWMEILTAPQKFYQLTAGMENSRVLFPFGEPMFARVTIRNISKYDITIGPDGTLRPDLWFDASMRGLVQQQVVGAAYERLGGPLVLKPGQTVSQSVRLDQGSLLGELQSRPQPSVTFYAVVRTNPRGEGGVGPCGYGVNFNSITERGGFPLTDNSVKSLVNTLGNGSPAERMRTLELMGILAETIRQTQPGDQQMMNLAKALVDALDRTRNDPVAGVATWAAFLTAYHAPDKRADAMQKLLKGELPERRLLGLMIANGLDPQQRIKLVGDMLKEEKSPMVRLYAEAVAELAEVQMAAMAEGGATTRPLTTRPTTGVTAPRPGPGPVPPAVNQDK